MVYLIHPHFNLSRVRGNLQRQSKQLESSEHSDSEEEIPPTPPDKLLGLAAKKMTSRITSPTAQRGTSSTAQRVIGSTAQQVTSPTAQRVATPSCEAMFSKLLTIVEEIKETQKVHGKMLNVLLKKEDASVMEVPDGVVFPLQTQADVEALEEKLGDRSLMSAVVSYFVCLFKVFFFQIDFH